MDEAPSESERAGALPAIGGEQPSHRLQRMLRPRSLCVVGASERVGSSGQIVLANLLAAGFRGALSAVNPKHRTVQGLKTRRRVRDLSEAPDLAILAVPDRTIDDCLTELAALGTRDVLMLPGPDSDPNRPLAPLPPERTHGLRIVGPDSLGIAWPAGGLDATLSRSRIATGSLAIVTQSSSICAALLDFAEGSGVGLSTVIATGAGRDANIAEVLDFLSYDPQTRSIAVQLRDVTHARALLGALRAAARTKPVVVLRTVLGRVGDEVFLSALNRSGVFAVDTFAELFGAVEWLATGRRVHGNRLAIVTNGAGLGELAQDACHRHGLAPASLQDLGATATPMQIAAAIEHAAAAGATAQAGADHTDPPAAPDAVLGLFCPTPAADSAAIAAALLHSEAQRGAPLATPAMFAFAGDADARHGWDLMNAAGHGVFQTPEAAVQAFAVLVAFDCSQRQLLQTPAPARDALRFDAEAVGLVISGALAAGQLTLDEMRSKQLLIACGISVPRTLIARTIEEATKLADRIGYPVVLKLASPDIVHKSEIGGVRLDIRDKLELRGAAAGIQQRLRTAAPQARFDGFTVQPMVRPPDAVELLVAVGRDPIFGPVIRFGAGGTTTEFIADTACALPPLNATLAHELIDRTRIARLLDGLRLRPPLDRDAVADLVLAVSTLVCRFPAIQTLEINPLLASADGVLALDARILLDPANPQRDRRYGHLAIHPYPPDVEKVIDVPGDAGARVLLRPIRPDDAAAELAFFSGLSGESRQWRFLHAIRALTPEMIARFTQIDYDRDMALVAVPLDDSSAPGAIGAPIIGVARYVREADAARCEFAIVVADAWQGRGIAAQLLAHLITHARLAGLQTMVGTIHGENLRMLAFVRHFGFKLTAAPDEPALRLATLNLLP